MGIVHVSGEELSALLDGELSAQDEARARQHLAGCARCSADYALSVRLDGELREPPALTCAEVLEVLSAGLDREAHEAEQAVGQRHLASCASCRDAVQSWSSLSVAIKALPLVAPSARTDDAIYALTRTRRARRGAPVRGIAARALIAMTAVLAVVVASLGTGGAPSPTALLPSPTPGRVLVASMQQIVFNSRNNTLYVLDTAAAAVDAREPATNDLKTRIAVGGEPSALALNESANTILVLDSSRKRVTEIDAATNTIIGATTVAVAGTPTSIIVDSSTSTILVSTVSTTTSSSSPGGGAVAVINSTTKQVETVRELDVAPRLVVPDQRGGRTALVSADATTLVDPSYKVIATLPGGVSAAFSRRGDTIAVLSPSASDSLVTFGGGAAPAALKLTGVPRALASLPDGGYLVFVDLGGRGQISKISHDGTIAGSVEVAVTRGDLVYDETTGRFAVANNGTLYTGEIPTQVAVNVAPTPQVTPTASPSPAPSATASSAPTPGATAPTVIAAAVPTFNPSVVEQARQVSPGLYSLALPPGVQPQLAATSGSRIWFLDQSNGVWFFDMNTGDTFTIGKLRNDARVSFWVAGSTYVYGVDATSGDIHVINTAREEIVDTYATNVLGPVSAAVVSPDNRLWIGLRSATYVLVFDPLTKRMDGFNLLGAHVSALAADSQGRIFYADDQSGAVGALDPRTSRLTELSFGRNGSTTALLVDATSTLWLGTSTGEVYAVRGGSAKLTVRLQRPVTQFAASQTGQAWYLAPLPGGLAGYSYAPADGSRAPKSVPGPALGLGFNPLGRAFLADPRGAMFMSIEGGL